MTIFDIISLKGTAPNPPNMKHGLTKRNASYLSKQDRKGVLDKPSYTAPSVVSVAKEATAGDLSAKHASYLNTQNSPSRQFKDGRVR